MSLKDRLHDSMRQDNGKSKDGFSHSKAYHRYFEGYSETIIPKSNGKGSRIVRVYIGDYFRQNLSPRKRITIRVLYVVLFVCAAVFYISSAVQPLTINSTWYVVLPEAISLLFLSWILLTFLSYIPAERDMTIEGYRSSSLSLLKATLGSATCLGIAGLTTLIFIVLNPVDEYLSVLLCSGKFFAAGLFALAMNRIESKVNYLTIPNQNKPFENGSEIK